MYRRDRAGDNHGGICVYAKQNVHSRCRQDIELPNIQCLWIVNSTHHKKIFKARFKDLRILPKMFWRPLMVGWLFWV